MMKTLIPLALVALMAGPASAACLAEYKAKRDNPLELFYGTAKINGACTKAAASAQLSRKLKAEGLTLLKVLSVSKQ
ncbi:hypothetical protein [Roseovarius sp. Pro17]|uniref:hypothetical protein n=1 Tax=Roseovarius sp. Pro17 TaxID=3108175 RepID=UPI002D78E166|nr:hypothetical protein [Roseovarius sp. Pro17]